MILSRETTGFVSHFLRSYPARSVLMVFLLIVAGLAEGIGVLTLLPVLEAAVGADGEAPSGVTRVFTEVLERLGLPNTLGVLLTLIVVTISLKGICRWLAMNQVGYAVANIARDLRLHLIRAVMKARWSHFSGHPTGYFANAISTEAHRASGAYRAACSAMSSVIQVIMYLTVVVLVSWQVALLTLAVGLGVVWVLRYFVAMSRQAGQRQTTLMKSLVRRLTDALPGIKPVKAMAREDKLLPLLERETEGLNQAQRRQVLASESMKALQEPILVLVIAVGLFSVLTWGSQPFSSVLVVVFLFYRVVGRVNLLQMDYQDVTVGESAFWSIRELIENAEADREVGSGTLPPPPLEKGVSFRGVAFAYGDTPVLQDVNLTLPSGRFVALVGPSGAGKTTLADLVAGLHRPQRGEVYLDDLPLAEVDLERWRRQIGYVPQETLLFNDTLFRNVTLGDEEALRADVRWALEAAGAWSFVSRLPQGMDQVIGEKGTKLSGGQRQRISIARALLRRPKLLILDEATTALDPETEAAICRTLRGLREEVTILAISHQPALREVADQVYQVVDGQVRLQAPAPGVEAVSN